MRNSTPMDLIDALAERIDRTVAEVNVGRTLTRDQHLAAFRRAFEVALPKFLREMRADLGDELVDRFEQKFLTQYELHELWRARHEAHTA